MQNGTRILTAGYGNRGFDGFIALMKSFGVTHLVDVRSVPQSSYWKDFGRERLVESIPPTGLKYIYMGDTLGAAQEPVEVETEEEPDADLHPLFHHPNFRRGLTALLKAAENPERVICLFCGCMRPHQCHRSKLIGEALVAEGVEVIHVSGEGTLVDQASVMDEIRGLQASLF